MNKRPVLDQRAKPHRIRVRQVRITLLLIMTVLLASLGELARMGSHAHADPYPTPAHDPPHLVFRYDDRGPDEIFAQGFRSVGLNTNLINHALGVGMRRTDTDCTEPNQTGSAFVSTTAHAAAVMRMAHGRLQLPQGATGERRVWIYTIRADGRFFGVLRSMQRVMDRMEDCDITPELQARLNTLDSLMNVARREGEWVAYRYIPPRLIHHATQYRLSNDGQDIEEIPGTRRDNTSYIRATSHANTIAWLIDAIARPGRSFAFRAYNQLNAATTSALERVRNGTFGAQFCTAGCLSPTSSTRVERATPTAPPNEAEIQTKVDTMVGEVLAQDLHDLAKSKTCTLTALYDPPESTPPFHSTGTCTAPEPFNLNGLMPNGFIWVDGHLSETTVPWASWDIDKGRGRKERPVYCTIDLGPVIQGTVHVRCQQNPYFTTYYVALQGSSGQNRIDTQFIGSDVTDVKVTAAQIPLVSTSDRMLTEVAAHNPPRQARLIQEVFNSPDWNSSIIVAPVYIAPIDPHPPAWHDELR